MRQSRDDEIPKDVEPAYARCHAIVASYLHWLGFTIMDTGRDPDYPNNHLLSCTSQDIVETAVMTLTCIREGIHNPVIREMRYLLETSVKLAYVQQKDYKAPVAHKLIRFKAELSDHKISRMRDIDLHYLADESKKEFYDDVGRMYGVTSKYVHHTSDVIQSRIDRLNEGRTIGRESLQDVQSVVDVIQKALSQSIVFIMHSVPRYVVGDYLVDYDKPLSDWHFLKYRFIAEIDTTLDYKHERQSDLAEIQDRRSKNVEF